MKNEAIYDLIADYARDMGGACSLEHALQHLVGLEVEEDVWSLDRKVMRNALRMRGLMLVDGMIATFTQSPASEIKDATDYSKFVKKATKAITAADCPIPATDLLNMIDLKDDDMPVGNMGIVLRRAGLFHIPGVGWWTRSSFIDHAGRVVMSSARGDRMDHMSEIFSKYGWPIRHVQIDKLSEGHIPANYLINNQTRIRDWIANIGGGLMAPTSELEKHRVPMSHDVAKLVIDSETRLLLFKEEPTLYLLARPLHEHGYAVTKYSMTMRSGKNFRTARYHLTPDGRKAVKAMLRLPPLSKKEKAKQV